MKTKMSVVMAMIVGLLVSVSCFAADKCPTENTPPIPKPDMAVCPQGNDVHKKLRPNEACLALVEAANPKNSVGLAVSKDEEYEMTAPANQLWCDSTIENHPPVGSDGTFMMNRFSFLKKAGEAKWFALIAEIDSEGKPYDISRSSSIKVAKDGSIILYANDAYGFYGNNSGKIYAVITRKK